MSTKKVFVSGCYDMLHSGHVAFFKEAAQTAMFPAMLSNGVQEWIDRYREQALAWKLSGAGGGGYLALVCEVPPR